MNHTRLTYDDCAYQHDIKESVGPGQYMLKTPRVDCDGPCFVPPPEVPLGSSGGATCDKELIDVDSELIGITRKASMCPTAKYMPTNKPFCNAKIPKECFGLTPEATRISNGPCTLRGIPNGFNRWEWLCTNPQAKAFVPFDYNISNRLVVKDNHRPCIQDPVDQSAAMPHSTNTNVCYDWSSKWSSDQFYPKVNQMQPPSWINTVCSKVPAL
jgi:hypothetical protein